MSVSPEPEDEHLLTVDELASASGLTVRTTRYYAGLGLLPPPERRGRIAYYGPVHQARLDLIRALQDHGFTLAAIEKYLKRLPDDAPVEELALQRAMLTSWAPGERAELTRRQLQQRAGRTLSDDDIEMLVAINALKVLDGGRFEALAPFDVGIQILGLSLPLASMVEAGDVIANHMDQLAVELTAVLREQVLRPLRRGDFGDLSAAEIEHTLVRLRQLTLESVVTGFQRASDELIFRTLDERGEPSDA